MNTTKRDLQSRMTATQQNADRPMTSYKAAGFSKNLGKDPRDVESNESLIQYFSEDKNFILEKTPKHKRTNNKRS